MKEWSSSSNREFTAAASTAGQPSYGNSVLNHSASCVVLPKHPTAQQLLYLKQRQLIKFAHPEDYVSALDSDSNISAAALLKALEQTSATSKKSLVSVLEIDRDKSIIPENVIFGTPELDLLKRLVLAESRPVDFFFSPTGDRQQGSKNPYAKETDVARHSLWESNQNENMTDWHIASLSIDTVELSEEFGALFWSTCTPTQTNLKEIQEMASVVKVSAISAMVELGFSPDVIRCRVRLKTDDHLRHLHSNNTFRLESIGGYYNRGYDTKKLTLGIMAQYQRIQIERSIKPKVDIIPKPLTPKIKAAPPAGLELAVFVQKIEEVIGDLWKGGGGSQLVEEDSLTMIAEIVQERWFQACKTIDVTSLSSSDTCERFVNALGFEGRLLQTALTKSTEAVGNMDDDGRDNTIALMITQLMKTSSLLTTSDTINYNSLSPTELASKTYGCSINFGKNIPALYEKHCASKHGSTQGYGQSYGFFNHKNVSKNATKLLATHIATIFQKVHASLIGTKNITVFNLVEAFRSLTSIKLKSLDSILNDAWNEQTAWHAGSHLSEMARVRVARRWKTEEQPLPRIATPLEVEETLKNMCTEDKTGQSYSHGAIVLFTACLDNVARQFIVDSTSGPNVKKSNFIPYEIGVNSKPGFNARLQRGIWGVGYLVLWFGLRDTFWKLPTDLE
mgnify:FL=1